jgi:hypothetical protein
MSRVIENHVIEAYLCVDSFGTVAHILNRRLCQTCTVCRDVSSPVGSSRSLPGPRETWTGSRQETAASGVLA